MHPIEPFLKLSCISKSFVSDDGETTPVIDNVSMDVSVGEFVVFLGPSGCGKTTLMRIVGGLETSNDGEVFLSGEKVTGPDRKKGMVFQAYTSFPWLTVLDNIRFGTRYRNDIGKMEKEAVVPVITMITIPLGLNSIYISNCVVIIILLQMDACDCFVLGLCPATE